MVRATSAAVYHQIQADGLLSKRRWEVYSYLYTHGPLTQMELQKALAPIGRMPHFWARFSELEEMRVVQTIGQKICTVTGRDVLLWDVTDLLPRNLHTVVHPSREEVITALLEVLEGPYSLLKERSKTETLSRWEELWLESAASALKAGSRHDRRKRGRH